MEKIVIALGADYQYANQVETVLKSILTHNKNIDFYLFNNDFPKEWFAYINSKIKILNSKLIDTKIKEDINGFQTAEGHITSSTYFRYFIPKYIKEDKVLYLDSDLIITQSLKELYNINLRENYAGGVKDDYIKDIFNSGVMLINNKKCREDNITQKLIDYTLENGAKLDLIDQTVLNIIFKDKFLYLEDKYNYQTGSLFLYQLNNEMDKLYNYYEKAQDLPVIIHYTSAHKPWLMGTSTIFRRLWWDYFETSWIEVINNCIKEKNKKKIFILTNSAVIESLEYLIKNLENYEINIAAYTLFAPDLLIFQKYPNCKIHQQILKPEVDRLIKESFLYLDINYYDEVERIVSKFHTLNKPVITFDTTNHDKENKSIVFKVSEVDEMIKYIKNL